jgi:predicted exporter
MKSRSNGKSRALRAWRPFVLVVLCLGVSYAALLGLIAWVDLRWHAFTLPALLLSLGTGSDYFIHLILRMQGGATAAVARGELGPALVVCAGSSMLGFGSLVTASSSGLASMGVVCAAALGLNLVAALLVMPWLWERWFSGNAAAGLPGARGTLG